MKKSVFKYFFLTSSFLFVIAFLIVQYYTINLPDVEEILKKDIPLSSHILDDKGEIIGEYAMEHRVYVSIDKIPQQLINAFISVEDKSFYDNKGFDLLGIFRASFQNFINIVNGNKLAGGSTISQQLVKNLLLTREQSISRKIKEIILSYKLNKFLSKDKIMELYLNSIYLGHRAYGIVAASNIYFNKDITHLSLSEMALIAGLPQAPSRLDPFKNISGAIRRRNAVLENMLDNRVITKSEFKNSLNQSVHLYNDRSRRSKYDFFLLDLVQNDIEKKYHDLSLFHDGLHIKTSINAKYQKIANDSLTWGLLEYDKRNGWRGGIGHFDLNNGGDWKSYIKDLKMPIGSMNWKKAIILNISNALIDIGLVNGDIFSIEKQDVSWLFKNKNLPLQVGDIVLVEGEGSNYVIQQIPEVNGSMLVMDIHSGDILAMVGGYNYHINSYNFVTQAMRQPGSLLKPFIYAAALENNFTPATIIPDLPISFYDSNAKTTWSPRNYERNFLGDITLRQGFEFSRNIVTITIARALGLNILSDTMKNFGIYNNDLSNLSNALGSLETTLISLTAAYATLGNAGIRVYPKLIKEIGAMKDGKVLDGSKFSHLYRTFPVISPSTSYQVLSLLEGAVNRGTARGIKGTDYSLAAKTGTSNMGKDHWFMALTPDIVVGVYVGYNVPKSLGDKETGARVALPIAKKFFSSTDLNPRRNAFSIQPEIHFERYDDKDDNYFFEIIQKGMNSTDHKMKYKDIIKYIAPKESYDMPLEFLMEY